MKVTLAVNYEDSEIQLSNADLEQIAKLMESRGEELARKVNLVHRKSVFQILTYAIKICNVITGRLRGAFTPFMRKFGFSGYLPYMSASPQGGSGGRDSGGRFKKGAVGSFDEAAAEAGAQEGSYIDQPLDTVISNNVAYAGYVDKKTGLVARILDWGQARYNTNFENFFAAVAKQNGPIPPVDPNAGGPEE